jgi:hypothetical protein
MADTFTTNLNLTKPEVGASTDTWGTKLNADLDTVDGLFSSTGTSVAMNLDGAVIDSSVIGGTTPAAGSFTNLDASGNITVGTNDTIIAENNIRFKPTGGAFIDHNTTGQNINFRLSNSSTLDVTPLVISPTTITVSGDLTVDTSTLKVDSTNNRVGIGTSSPSHDLTIQKSGQDNYIRIGSNSDGYDAGVYFGTNADWSIGIDNSNSNAFSIASGSTVGTNPRVTINSSGNVGIGTTSPGTQLTLNKNDNNFLQIRSSDTGNAGIYFGRQNDSVRGAIVYDNSNESIQFLNNNYVERMRIDSSGNVGIGASSVTQGKVDILAGGDYDAHTGHGLTINSNANNAYTSMYMGADDSVDAAYIQSAGRNTSFTSKKLLLNPNGGNVGIGTDSPSSQDASANNLVISDTAGNGGLTINTPTNAIGAIHFSDGTSGADRYRGIISYGHSDNTMRFHTDTARRMTIDSSGSVGIGTSSPQTSTKGLHVVHDATEGTPSFPDGEVIIAQRNFNSSQGCHIGIIGGSAGESAINFGDKDNSDVGNITYNHSANRMEFVTNAAERMRIDSSGKLLVGTTTDGATSNMRVVGTVTNANVGVARFDSEGSSDTANTCISIVKGSTDTTTSQVFVKFAVDGYNSGNGQINANGSGAAAFGSFSDRRLKENIIDLPSQLENIIALQPKEFDYIESEGGGHQIGFIAQEVEEIYPDLVGEREDGMKTITGMGKMEARLIKAIQEQQTQIDALQSEINLLKGE